jgi:hypothetical protein
MLEADSHARNPTRVARVSCQGDTKIIDVMKMTLARISCCYSSQDFGFKVFPEPDPGRPPSRKLRPEEQFIAGRNICPKASVKRPCKPQTARLLPTGKVEPKGSARMPTQKFRGC